MPLISYKCEKCGLKKDRLVSPKQLKTLPDKDVCPSAGCGGDFIRLLGAPKSVSKIIIDDGQAKAIEVMPDIQEILDRAADKGPDRGFGQN